MGTVGYLLLLALAILVAAQCLMLMERHRPVNTRLRDLGYGGDAGLLAMAMTLVGAAIGALIGHAMGTPGVGGALGASVASSRGCWQSSWRSFGDPDRRDASAGKASRSNCPRGRIGAEARRTSARHRRGILVRAAHW